MGLVLLLGIFFVPLATSDLRGLTHVLTCEAEVEASLFVRGAQNDDAAVLLSADSVTAPAADGSGTDVGLCDGLFVRLELRERVPGEADVDVVVTNAGEHSWQGSLDMRIAGTQVPIRVGRVSAGTTESDTVRIDIDEGRSYEITGTLLIGP